MKIISQLFEFNPNYKKPSQETIDKVTEEILQNIYGEELHELLTVFNFDLDDLLVEEEEEEEEDIMQNAKDDPDAQPLTDEQLNVQKMIRRLIQERQFLGFPELSLKKEFIVEVEKMIRDLILSIAQWETAPANPEDYSFNEYNPEWIKRAYKIAEILYPGQLDELNTYNWMGK